MRLGAQLLTSKPAHLAWASANQQSLYRRVTGATQGVKTASEGGLATPVNAEGSPSVPSAVADATRRCFAQIMSAQLFATATAFFAVSGSGGCDTLWRTRSRSRLRDRKRCPAGSAEGRPGHWHRCRAAVAGRRSGRDAAVSADLYSAGLPPARRARLVAECTRLGGQMSRPAILAVYRLGEEWRASTARPRRSSYP